MTGLLFLLIAIVAAQAVQLIPFFQGLFANPQYRFFPIGLAIAVWLLWLRRTLFLEERHDRERDIRFLVRHQGYSTKTVTWGMIGVGLCFAATLLQWPYLAWMTTLWMLAVVAYLGYGKFGIRASLPILILLLFLQPIPPDLEPWVQLGMQSTITSLASIILDYLGILHYLQGVSIALITQESPSDAICHGADWLYAVMFAAIAWGIYYHYHWIRTTLVVVQAVLWVIIFNALRIVVLLANKHAGGTWLESDAVLLSLHFGTLAGILFFVWSGDQFVSSLFPTRATDESELATSSQEISSLLSSGWKWRSEFSILVGALGLLLLLSLRLIPVSNLYGAAMSPDPSKLNVSQWSSGWEVSSPSTQTLRSYDGVAIERTAWEWKKDNSVLTLTWDSHMPVYAGPTWSARWTGWRDVTTKSASPILETERFPAEYRTSCDVAVDRDGTMIHESGWVANLLRARATVMANLWYAVGADTSENARGARYNTPVESLSLQWKSAKPLDQAQKEELLAAWNQVLPGVKHQLFPSPSE